jgi:YD repeat-containing protein
MSSQLSGYIYQVGPACNVISATESNGRTESWSYDGIYRLTNATISLAPNQPRPDPAGAGFPMPFADQAFSMNLASQPDLFGRI